MSQIKKQPMEVESIIIGTWIRVTAKSKLPEPGLYFTCSRKKSNIEITEVSMFWNPSYEERFRKRYRWYSPITLPTAPKI